MHSLDIRKHWHLSEFSDIKNVINVLSKVLTARLLHRQDHQVLSPKKGCRVKPQEIKLFDVRNRLIGCEASGLVGFSGIFDGLIYLVHGATVILGIIYGCICI